MKQSTLLDTAIGYRRVGWYPIPVPYKQKGPDFTGWQNLRLEADQLPQYFNGAESNIGVLTGSCSGDLVDADLDQLESLDFATWLLPPTRKFGRPGNPHSHWLFHSPTDVTRIQFFVMIEESGKPVKRTFIELRSNGHQTVFPPSTHPSGEPIRWTNNLPLAEMSFDDLQQRAGRIAAGAALAQAWPREKGCRHDCELALAGILLRCGFTDPDAERFIYTIATIANTENAGGRAKNVVVTTKERLEAGKPCTGWRSLSKLLNKPDLLSKVPEWLGYTPEQEASVRLSQPDEENSNLDTADKPALANLNNAVRIIEKDPAFCQVWFDEFQQRILTGNPPREWSDADDINLTLRFQREKKMTRMSRDTVSNAVTAIAFRNQRNCIKDWLEALRWDGITRLELFFPDYFGTDITAYTQAAGKNFLISMVARIYKPGCQVDTMPVLEGRQGILKSSSLRVLAGEHHSEQHESVTSKDFFQNLQGKWLIEISEMDSFSRTETSKVKQVISCTTDHFRPSYGRRAVDHPRMCVFTGTTNHDDWNKDSTGARRFWPITCSQIDLEGIRNNRNLLFAEAVHRFRNGESWWEMPPVETTQEQELRYDTDVWQADIETFIRPLGQVTVREILSDCLKVEVGKMGRVEGMRVASVLKVLHWQKIHTKMGNVWRAPGDYLDQ